MRNRQKPLTDSEVRGLTAGPKRSTHALGESLFLVVEPASKGGGKRLVGRYRQPPGRQGKQKEYAIDVYGKKVGQFSLKEAREEWAKVRAWGTENGKDLQDYKHQQRREEVEVKQELPTLKQAADEYLENSRHRPSTKKDYTNCIYNQVLPGLGAATPLENFTWGTRQKDGRTGRRIVLDWKKGIEKRAPVQSDKALMVLRQVFDYAIDQGWLDAPNPAFGSKHAKSKSEVKHHPTLEWNELPEFFERLQKNEPRGSMVVVSAVKVLFLTFLRVNSLAGLRWEELDYKKNLWTVPASRMKNKQKHLVPLTDQLKEVFDQLRDLNGNEEYAFYTGHSRERFPYMNPSSINAHLIRMGYKGILVGHGVRSIPLTAGQEILGFSHEVIQRQMAHSVGDRVRQAYDRSQMMDERRKFMIAWCDALVEQGLIT